MSCRECSTNYKPVTCQPSTVFNRCRSCSMRPKVLHKILSSIFHSAQVAFLLSGSAAEAWLPPASALYHGVPRNRQCRLGPRRGPGVRDHSVKGWNRQGCENAEYDDCNYHL